MAACNAIGGILHSLCAAVSLPEDFPSVRSRGLEQYSVTFSFLATATGCILESGGYSGRESEPEGQLQNLSMGSRSEKNSFDIPVTLNSREMIGANCFCRKLPRNLHRKPEVKRRPARGAL